MNNFEKRIFIDYLDKLIYETDVNDYTFQNVFDFFINEFKIDKKVFKTDRYGDLCLGKTHDRTKFFMVLKKEISKLQNTIKTQNTSLEKKLLFIKEIYSLDKDEYNLLLFFSLQEINNIIKMYLGCLRRSSVNTFMNKYLGIRVSQQERLLDKLRLKNILIDKNSTLNPNLLYILDSKKFNTKEKITELLVGKPQKSELIKSDYLHLEEELNTVTKILSSAIQTKKKGINILLYGGVGTGKTEFAKLIANEIKVPLYAVITEKEKYQEANREDRLIDLSCKQNILSKTKNACILFDEAEDAMNRGFSSFGNASKGYFNNLLDNILVPVIWTTNNIYDVDPAFLRRMTYCVEFSKLTEETRLEIWNKVLKKNKLKVNQSKVIELNKSYDIPPSLIANAVETTKMIGGNEEDFENFISNVAKVVTKKSNVKKGKEFEMSEYDENLVNADLDISNLTSKIKNCGKLNFSLCLYGEPGTGKSLYAKYLAKELGIEVIFKRASDLLGMYVGESEKNIADAFAEAKSKKAMLIFDEADSFLQNRNNAVRSWEVSQVNEMLTRMESHEYPFVCTTNLLNTLDEASLRRFTFKIKFDFMTKEQANKAFTHFFHITDYNLDIKGLTAGDFATVKKKADFLNIKDADELKQLLLQEVKLKSSKELKNSVGF